MAEEDLIKIARDSVEAFNVGDFEGSTAAMTADSILNEFGTQRKVLGAAAVREVLKGWKQAMPDVTGTVTNAFASGNNVALEVTWRGTHTGPLESPGGTIPASGKTVVTPGSWVFEFEGDKIKESRHYFDMVTFLQQIGAMPN